MLISKTVEMRWNSRNKSRFVELGYEFTKMRDIFMVDVHDLSNGSSALVDIECDYCGRIYQKPWINYILENEKSAIHKDCCVNCKNLKTQEAVMEKYGVVNVFQLNEIKEKIRQTNLEKYGAENPFASEVIKERIIETNLKKYGEVSCMKVQEIKEKAKKTCLEKYGYEHYNQAFPKRGAESPFWKGGVEHHRVERATFEYRTWRKDVYHRDNHTCQCCKSRSCAGHPLRLEAHHIKNWKDNEDSRYDVDNGITLCQDCHVLFHQIYGKNLNNESQLEEFLLNYGKKIC